MCINIYTIKLKKINYILKDIVTFGQSDRYVQRNLKQDFKTCCVITKNNSVISITNNN